MATMKYTFDDTKHAHSLDGQPMYGTSTVVKEVMPPFLAKWGANCAVDYIKENSEEEDGGIFEVEKQTLDDAVLAYNKVRDDAADKGTDRHALLEKWVKTCIIADGGKPVLASIHESIQSFADWAVANVDHFIFSEKCTYSKKLWVGGIVDCLAEMKDGTLAVIDFKSSKEAYFNQFAQCAGYALQLEESGYGNEDGSEWTMLDRKIDKLIVIPFGAKALKPEIITNVQGFEEVFAHIVRVYEFLHEFAEKKKTHKPIQTNK